MFAADATSIGELNFLFFAMIHLGLETKLGRRPGDRPSLLGAMLESRQYHSGLTPFSVPDSLMSLAVLKLCSVLATPRSTRW